ncbi:MAG: hypothetical protein WDO13_16575 [Verrucomicrobiota bacterium]
MNRTTTIPAPAGTAPDRLMGTLAIMGFAAEDNLRCVAKALGQRDCAALGGVAERNAKQPRLRAEIEEQIVDAMARLPPGAHARHKLVLTARVALLFERMGAQTVALAGLCDQVLADPRPSRVGDLRKLIEHAVYITDRAATGLIEEDPEMAKIALEQLRAATELDARVGRELAALADARGDALPRVDLLTRIACRANDMIEDAGRLADNVLAFLAQAEL